MRRRRRAGEGVRLPTVLVGLGETAGYCARLVDGLRSIGVRADHLNLGEDPMAYALDRPGRGVRLVRWLGRRRRDGPGPRAAWALVHRLALVWLFLVAVRRYDAFVLRAGDSFFALRDLPLLRRLGKRVVVVFFGSDSRPSYLNGAELATRDGAALAATTAAKRRMVERIERHADVVVCHVMSAQLHRRRAVRFLEIGIPRSAPVSGGRVAPSAGGPVRFLHAPSRSVDKGTARVEAVVDRLRAGGLPIELRVVAGRPNHEVLAEIAASDVVIDQLYSDTPMAALAAEAASLGRPAIVGGYGWDELRAASAPDALPPSELCDPDALAEAIRRLATDAAARGELGERAHRFVAERWSPEQVARRFLDLIRGDVPDAWWFDPADVAYAEGAGATAEAVGDGVRRVLEAAGPAGLAVDDKPELLERLLTLASGRPAGEAA